MPSALRFEIVSASDSASAAAFPGPAELKALADEALRAQQALRARTCPGSEFLGWIDLPQSAEEWVPEILDLALQLVEEVDHLVVVGIGGSYLGARALLEAFARPGPNGGLILLDQAGWEPIGPEIHFAGEHLGGGEMLDLLRRLRQSSFAVNVISKSGTTLETAVAFRLLRQELEERYGDGADRRIIATTDPERGALRAMATQRGWRSFPIPPDLGGRFSVLSPVGLLPLAAAGMHVEALLEGARAARELFLSDVLLASSSGRVELLLNNPALHYAALRKHFHDTGKAIEVLASFEPTLSRLGDWWTQLFGESEGKEGKGLFPARAAYSTDLHSLGQYLQDGPRKLFETFITVDQPPPGPAVPERPDDEDRLNRLAGRELAEINRAAELGTMAAHDQGGVPVLRVGIAQIQESFLGELIYFFEAACATSALMLGVNPFDQPGVETYKREMRERLED